MARIRTLTTGSQNVKVHPTEVDCSYQIIRSDNGEVFLQLSTFGSDTRASQPKTSQTIQMSSSIALQLADIIHANFGTD